MKKPVDNPVTNRDIVDILQDEVKEVKADIKNLDKKTWLILIAMALLFAKDMPTVTGVVGQILAMGR